MLTIGGCNKNESSIIIAIIIIIIVILIICIILKQKINNLDLKSFRSKLF